MTASGAANYQHDRYLELVRALNIVPYLRAHPTHTAFEAAINLGMKPSDAFRALQRAHISGVANSTGPLLELAFESSDPFVGPMNQGAVTPLRLTTREATALLLMLEHLEDHLIDPTAARSAAAKIRAAKSQITAGLPDTDPDVRDPDLAVVTEALHGRRRLAMTYWNASRLASEQRLVDPVRLVVRDGETYLLAWDDSRGEHRSFRLDRISDPSVTDERANPHHKLVPDDPFAFSHNATVRIQRRALWLQDYVPLAVSDSATVCEARAEETDGEESVLAELAYGSRDWLIRFCLSHADRLTLLSPADAAAEVARRAKLGLAGYDEQST
ncbi:helix-turn-helix transcriptional regulator [Corynebacterium uterequi]|uniref:Putative transcriptional regulator n=1 Tax=Corynebacterium uterequi TaxID=1072256 RepID=A0A0G3HCG4_9CORY|nr:WYL domain-containing protein [Corynebacterium uterequi]AKK11081.1 putative transcriptional regulator [Corynebacterium uterequi]